MSLRRETFLDLLACLAASDGHMRFAASVILSRECVARFADAERDYPGVTSTHPAFGDLDVAGTRSGLDALLSLTSKPADTAASAARWFIHNDREPSGVHYLDGATRRPPRAEYVAALNSAEKLAAQLRARVVGDVGPSAFAAARAPYAEQLDEFSTTAQQVAWFGVLASAGPGEHFRIHHRYKTLPGYGVSGMFGAPPWEITVPAAGTYHCNFHGAVCSSGAGAGLEASVAIDVGGVEALSYTATRASADVRDAVDIGDMREYFRAGQSAALTIDNVAKKIRVRNASGNSQSAGALMVMWRA